eukprot:gene2622-1620_t
MPAQHILVQHNPSHRKTYKQTHLTKPTKLLNTTNSINLQNNNPTLSYSHSRNAQVKINNKYTPESPIPSNTNLQIIKQCSYKTRKRKHITQPKTKLSTYTTLTPRTLKTKITNTFTSHLPTSINNISLHHMLQLITGDNNIAYGNHKQTSSYHTPQTIRKTSPFNPNPNQLHTNNHLQSTLLTQFISEPIKATYTYPSSKMPNPLQSNTTYISPKNNNTNKYKIETNKLLQRETNINNTINTTVMKFTPRIINITPKNTPNTYMLISPNRNASKKHHNRLSTQQPVGKLYKCPLAPTSIHQHSHHMSESLRQFIPTQVMQTQLVTPTIKVTTMIIRTLKCNIHKSSQASKPTSNSQPKSLCSKQHNSKTTNLQTCKPSQLRYH